MVEPMERRTVVYELSRECPRGRRIGRCYRDGQDGAEALIRAGLVKD
jgi:endonuclease YncB( thermonuclease family)